MPTPTALDVRARASALRLLNKYGKTISYTHNGPASYNTATSRSTPGSTTTVSVKGYPTSPTEHDIKMGVLQDETVLLIAAAALSFEPTPLDAVTFDGKTWTVRPVSPIYSGEQVALWYVAIKRKG
jgi:hypothetical protein